MTSQTNKCINHCIFHYQN